MFCDLYREIRSRNLNRCNLDKSRIDRHHAIELCRFLLLARDGDNNGLLSFSHDMARKIDTVH